MPEAGLYDRLLATEVTRWPPAVREHAFALPFLSVSLEERDRGLHLADEIPERLPGPAFPKLAIKSWQESGRLRIVPEEAALRPALVARISTPTKQQNLILPAWAETGEPLFLHLFPYRDFSAISEARFLVDDRKATRTSLCLRGPDAQSVTERLMEAAHALAAGVQSRMNMGRLIVQIAFERTDRVSVVDINPTLDAQDVEALHTALDSSSQAG